MTDTSDTSADGKFHIEYPRVIPARKPVNHKPAVVRYTLRWQKPHSSIISQYHAIQRQGLSHEEQQAFFDRMTAAFGEEDGPSSFEKMIFVDEEGELNAVVVSYWLDATAHARWTLHSSISQWFEHPDRLNGPIGCWRETLAVPYDRHETTYSRSHYKIGLARTAEAEIVPDTTNGYFGAARDRLPVSAIDLLDSPLAKDPPQARTVESRGRRLVALAPHNMAAMRSGQYWEAARDEQLADYEDNMQPKLERGMAYLAKEKEASGTLALREMTNVDEAGQKLAETSTLGYFKSLEDLETWAKTHSTHLAIYHHAIKMNNKFKKEGRQVVTWHELFMLHSCNPFEYINCHSKTGILPFAKVYTVA